MSALYNLDAARGAEQLERMRALEAEGVCIFCPEHAGTWQREPVEREGEHWYVTRNDFPYAGTAAHYLIVARRHVQALRGAARRGRRRAVADPPRAGRSGSARRSYATVERSGDMRLNGGSVEHLHVHFVALGPDAVRTPCASGSARGARDDAA